MPKLPACVRRWVILALRAVYLLYLAARDNRVPALARVVAAGCTAYVFAPINLIPDELPVIGELDDAVVVILGLVVAKRLIPAGLLAELEATAAARFADTGSIAVPEWIPRALARVSWITARPALLAPSLGLSAVVTLAILLPLSLDAVTGNGQTTTGAFSADTLWTLAFLQDIFVHGGRLGGWNLGQHVDFFPDKLFSSAAYAISSRPERWLLVFEILNLALYFGIARYCLRRCLRGMSDKVAAGRIALWGALLVTAFPPFLRSWGLFGDWLMYVGTPSNHFGQFFCAILAAFLAVDCLPRALNGATICRLGLACALMMLCALSDKLTIIVAVPGFIVAALYFVAVRRTLSSMPVVGCASFCATAAVAYFVSDPLWNRITQVLPARPALLDPASIKRLMQPMAQSLLTRSPLGDDPESSGISVPPLNDWDGTAYVLRHLDPAQIAILGVALVSVSALTILYARRAASGSLRPAAGVPARAAAEAFVVYLVASAWLIPLALFALGILIQRFAYPAGYCLLWALVARLGERLPATWSRPQFAFGMVATGLLLSNMPVDAAAPPFRRLAKPPLVSCLEEFGQSRDLRLGLGSHWETYPVEFLSKGRLTVLSIGPAGQISHWVNNIDWYAPRPDGGLFTFIIADGYLDEPGLRENIGAPSEVLNCASLGRGSGDGRILYYDGAAAERLTAWIHQQYRELKRSRLHP